jgi:putative hydrolase of the HAD superfamily
MTVPPFEGMPMIRAVLIDFDGVLRRWDPEDTTRAEEQCGLPKGAILRTAFAPDLLRPTITGRATDETWRQQIAERLRAEHPSAQADRAVSLWSESPGEVDQRVLSMIRSCQERAAMVLVTNATSRLDRDLARLGLATTFDHVINSSVVGHAKPDPAFFAAALATVGVAADEAFYIDDDAGNVAAATRIGIAGHHYRGLETLMADLLRFNLVS